MPAGKVRLRLNCLTVPRRSKGKVIFFFNGKTVPQRKVRVRDNEIELRVRSRKAGVSRLLWICEPLIERGTEHRRLGLSIISVSVEQRLESH